MVNYLFYVVRVHEWIFNGKVNLYDFNLLPSGFYTVLFKSLTEISLGRILSFEPTFKEAYTLPTFVLVRSRHQIIKNQVKIGEISYGNRINILKKYIG